MSVTSALGELESLSAPMGITDEETNELEARRAEWLENRSLAFATEFASTALVVRRTEAARDAAEFILTHGEAATRSERAIATRVLGGEDGPRLDPFSEDQPAPAVEIHSLRKRLSNNPRNPVAWSDLALAHAVEGQRDKARRAMTAAVRLAPDNRFILRAGARFWIWRDDPERAHKLLVNAGPTRTDPWLAGSEIAVAGLAGRKPMSVRAGRSMLKSDGFKPRHLSELAGAMATLELKSGGSRRARQLFRQSLAEPNENALAQAEWASSRLEGLELSEFDLREPNAYEARARFDEAEGSWQAAFDEAMRWRRDQAFAADPAILASHAAAVGLLDFKVAADVAKRGLELNPGDPFLTNNLAYSALEMGQLYIAASLLAKVDVESLEPVRLLHHLGNQGLLAFKVGDYESGRTLYRRAMALGQREGLRSAAAMAALMLARQEILVGGEDAPAAVRRAFALADKTADSAVDAWRARLEAHVFRGEALP